MQRLKVYLLNLWFYSAFISCFALIPVFALLVAICRPFESHRQAMRQFRRLMVLWGRIVTALPFPLVRLRYELQGTNDTGRSYIFVCNHRSAIDAFLLGVLPHEFVEIVNDWPFRIPVLGIFARFADFLDIRNMSHDQFMQRAGNLLAEGVSIVFFPEGTRSPGREMGSFHSAAFRLAVKAQVPIIPLCFAGNETVMPKGSPLLYPGTVRVRQLPPLQYEEFAHMTPFALKSMVWKIMDRELAAMEGTT
jgi:1-acyl-sn-glycerol-3-phosphate acyltransferase